MNEKEVEENQRKGRAEMTDERFEGNSTVESMDSGKVEKVVVAKIKMGVSLLRALEEIALREGIQAGLILSGVGALKAAVFRNLKEFPQEFPVSPQNRLYFKREQPLEILSLTGHISRTSEGKPEIHAHFSASAVDGDKIVAFGGHLTEEAITYVKVVVAIAALSGISMVTQVDPATKSPDLVVGG